MAEIREMEMGNANQIGAREIGQAGGLAWPGPALSHSASASAWPDPGLKASCDRTSSAFAGVAGSQPYGLSVIASSSRLLS